jgi:small-conductance mechanosensitive channel
MNTILIATWFRDLLENNLALKYIALIIGTLLIASILSLILRRAMGLLINRKAKLLKVEETNYVFLKNSITFVIFTGAIIFIFFEIPQLKSLGTALFAGAGIIAAIIGFASQKAFSNIISGIFLLIFKPFRVGDILEISDTKKGVVEEITLRHTVIKDYENRRIIIPNSIISEQTLENSSISDERIKKWVEFGISYDSNVDHAIRIIREEAEKHPNFIDTRTPEEIKSNVPKVTVRMIAHSDFSINLRAYVWTRSNDDAFVLKCDILKSVKERFDKEGIEIPFPYRTIVYKKDIVKNE